MQPGARHTGRRIRGKRLALALSQKEVAQAIGMTVADIEAFETDHASVPAEVLDRLADFFNVPLSYFLPSGTAER